MTESNEQGKFFIQNTMLLYGIGTIAALARLGIKGYMTRRLGVEEVIMIVSLLCWTVDTYLIVLVVLRGTNQVPDERRISMPPEEAAQRISGSKCFIGAWYAYTTAIWGCKTAILIFYKRLTDRTQTQRSIKIASAVLLVTYLVCILGISLVCRPFHGLWQIYPNPGPACTDGYHFVFLVGTLNIATDLMLLIIPMPLLRHLQVSLFRKVLLGGMFGLGIFVVIATALRIYYTVVGGNISNMTFWSMIETATLFIVSNAPGIRAIFTYRSSPSSSSNSDPRTYELQVGGNKQQASQITTQVRAGPGDSTEHIIDTQQGNDMVIHQHITYNIRVEHDALDIESARSERSSSLHNMKPTRSSLSRGGGDNA